MSNANEICKLAGVTIQEIEEFYTKNAQLNKLESEVKAFKTKLKNAMVSTNTDNCTFGKLDIKITYQNRDSIDEEKLADILISKGLEDALIIKKIPNPDKLKDLIASGDVTSEDIQSCTIPNRIAVLKLPKANKEIDNSKAEAVKKSSTNKGRF